MMKYGVHFSPGVRLHILVLCQTDPFGFTPEYNRSVHATLTHFKRKKCLCSKFLSRFAGCPTQNTHPQQTKRSMAFCCTSERDGHGPPGTNPGIGERWKVCACPAAARRAGDKLRQTVEPDLLTRSGECGKFAWDVSCTTRACWGVSCSAR